MYKSGSTKLVKNLNKHHILNLVRLNPGIIARSISDETGLQMSTVLKTLKSLEQDGVIKNLGVGNTTYLGGKPPATWGISSDYGFVVGIELSSKEIRLVLLNFRGKILNKNIVELNFTNDAEELAESISETVGEFMIECEIDSGQILGMGFGVPGSVDHESGKVIYSYSYDFHDVNLKELLEVRLNHWIELDNDANAGALGVKWLHGDFKELSNIIYLSIQQKYSGAGLGFVLNNQVYRGGNSAAGEIPSFLTDKNLNRLFQIASGKEPENQIISVIASDMDEFDLSVIAGMAGEGSRASQYILREIGKVISKQLIQLTNLFDPDAIILGGDICRAGKFILPVIKDRLKLGIVSDAAREVPVHFSEFGQYSGAIGAAALIFQKVFDSV